MQNRVVEIATDGAHVSLSRGFLSVSKEGKQIGQVALDDMCALVIRGYGATLSANICGSLAESNIPIVVCNSNQVPASVVWPVSGHFSQGLHFQAQASTNKPLLNRLWAELIKNKIHNQSKVLEFCGLEYGDIRSLAKRVKSGDKGNLEALASQRYWPRLLGVKFRRNRSAENINSALNYGYTILRAAMARAILAAGLHPSLSVHHQSRGDALRLADDLMEPFRPWVDYTVFQIANMNSGGDILKSFELDRCHKLKLAEVLSLDLTSARGASTVQVCMDHLAQSLVQIFLGNRRTLELPDAPIPLSLRTND